MKILSYLKRFEWLILTFTAIFYRSITIYALYPLRVVHDNLLLSDILNLSVSWPWYTMIVVGILNLIIIYCLLKKNNPPLAFFTGILYAISPAVLYAEITNSIYVLFTFLILLTILIWQTNSRFKILLLTLVFITSLAFSWFMIIFLLVSAGLYINRKKDRSKLFWLFGISGVFLSTSFIINHQAIVNIIHRDFPLFFDIGLNNTVNQFRGEIPLAFSLLAKIGDSRIIYLVWMIFAGLIKTLWPFSYFGNFSPIIFHSPYSAIPAGTLIFFIFGIYQVIKLKRVWIVSMAFLLSVPSMFNIDPPIFFKLTPLILLLIYISALGFNYLKAQRKIFKFVIAIACLLIVMESLSFITDSTTREVLRADTQRTESGYK